MKDFEIFVEQSAVLLVFFGLFLVAVFLAWLSWKNSRIAERERKIDLEKFYELERKYSNQ